MENGGRVGSFVVTLWDIVELDGDAQCKVSRLYDAIEQS